MDEKDIEENSQLKSGNSNFFVINMKKLLSKITLRKIRYPRCKQANNILSVLAIQRLSVQSYHQHMNPVIWIC